MQDSPMDSLIHTMTTIAAAVQVGSLNKRI